MDLVLALLQELTPARFEVEVGFTALETLITLCRVEGFADLILQRNIDVVENFDLKLSVLHLVAYVVYWFLCILANSRITVNG